MPVEENWKEASRSAELRHESATKTKECEEEGRDIPRKAPTSETLYRTVPHRTAPRRQAATNRSLRLLRLTAPVLSTRGDRDGHAAARTSLPPHLQLSRNGPIDSPNYAHDENALLSTLYVKMFEPAREN